MSEPFSIGAYLTAKEQPNASGRTTKIWGVYSKRHGDILGEVRWYPAWRQYVFCPMPESIYNGSCLVNIKDFLKKCNLAQRSGASGE